MVNHNILYVFINIGCITHMPMYVEGVLQSMQGNRSLHLLENFRLTQFSHLKVAKCWMWRNMALGLSPLQSALHLVKSTLWFVSVCLHYLNLFAMSCLSSCHIANKLTTASPTLTPVHNPLQFFLQPHTLTWTADRDTPSPNVTQQKWLEAPDQSSIINYVKVTPDGCLYKGNQRRELSPCDQVFLLHVSSCWLLCGLLVAYVHGVRIPTPPWQMFYILFVVFLSCCRDGLWLSMSVVCYVPEAVLVNEHKLQTNLHDIEHGTSQIFFFAMRSGSRKSALI